MKKITTEYCRELLERYDVGGAALDSSDSLDARLLRLILKEATPDSRFRVGFDPASYNDDEDSWDLIGPAVPFGRIFYDSRGEAERDRDSLNMILREHFGPNPRKVQYTQDSHLAKCLLDGPCCPVCGSEKISLENHRIKGGATCVFVRGCHDCNSEWEEVFGLQNYQNVRID